MDTQIQERLLRENEVARITGLSRSLRWRLIRAGQFPKSIPVTDRIRAWRASEIERWIAERVAAAERLREGAR